MVASRSLRGRFAVPAGSLLFNKIISEKSRIACLPVARKAGPDYIGEGKLDFREAGLEQRRLYGAVTIFLKLKKLVQLFLQKGLGLSSD